MNGGLLSSGLDVRLMNWRLKWEGWLITEQTTCISLIKNNLGAYLSNSRHHTDVIMELLAYYRELVSYQMID